MWSIVACDIEVMYYEMNHATRIYIFESKSKSIGCTLFYQFINENFVDKVFYAEIMQMN